MTENFITKINVVESSNVKNLEIQLSKDHRQHLILTGKHGSGKTSLLLEMNKYLTQIDSGMFQMIPIRLANLNKYKDQLKDKSLSEEEKLTRENRIKDIEKWFLNF